MSDVRNKPCMSHYPDFDHHCASKGQGCEYYEPLEKSIELIHSLMTQNPLDNLISDIYKENGYEGYAQKIMGAWINIKEKLEEKADEN